MYIFYEETLDSAENFPNNMDEKQLYVEEIYL